MRLTEFLAEQMSDQDDPYAAGMRAWRKGGANPFKKGASNTETENWHEWELGYEDAQVDQRGGSGEGLEEAANISDFTVAVDFGDGTFKRSGSFHSEQAAKREGRQLCTTDGSGKKYKITYPTGKTKVFTPEGKKLEESESNYIAMSSYQAKAAQVDDEIEKLKLNMMKHRKEYLATDRTNWGYAGDMERLLKQLTEINDWLGKQ